MEMKSGHHHCQSCDDEHKRISKHKEKFSLLASLPHREGRIREKQREMERARARARARERNESLIEIENENCVRIENRE
jgi:hypothetical protein